MEFVLRRLKSFFILFFVAVLVYDFLKADSAYLNSDSVYLGAVLKSLDTSAEVNLTLAYYKDQALTKIYSKRELAQVLSEEDFRKTVYLKSYHEATGANVKCFYQDSWDVKKTKAEKISLKRGDLNAVFSVYKVYRDVAGTFTLYIDDDSDMDLSDDQMMQSTSEWFSVPVKGQAKLRPIRIQ